MKLAKWQLGKIEAEILEKYRHKGTELYNELVKKLTDLKLYLTDDEIKRFKKIPSGYCPKVSSVRIDLGLIKNKSDFIKNNDRMSMFRNIYFRDYRQARFEIELESEFELPAFATKLCNCNSYHAVMKSDATEFMKDIIEHDNKSYHLKKELKNMIASCKTLKALKENYLGISELAPKAMAEIEQGQMVGALVVKTDLSKYKLEV